MFSLSRFIKAKSAWRNFNTKYQFIDVKKEEKVSIITMNRPKASNALCDRLIHEIVTQLKKCDRNPETNAIVLTGLHKVFAAGADVKEMEPRTFQGNFSTNFSSEWDEIAKTRKPLIAAVNGFALGGGCEIAMMCDIIIAGENSKFGHPEIKLGTFSGAGGTQRLTRAVGKAKAMEMLLTGELISAREAWQSGLVSRIVPDHDVVDIAIKIAAKIAANSQPMAMMAKECINQAYESTLQEGLEFERRMFQSTFAFYDREEGMKSFINKRDPEFKDA
ncbi:unnamed protein product [Blepharisma stoltei]|uniref:Probable enoyl-CoA hydratase, mitochondrial n=1 Tax=Blepharisma stoltei TaxID=1481888 RepID=A0AAU9JXR5_9CILI|nr:unnamed protein product [Blepharisma stoltei]